ncbi:MAG: sensor histidine kinase [Pseudanabaena sp.]|nr:MAG: sensor histidine kinase [Pseudanabaena sp.]
MNLSSYSSFRLLLQLEWLLIATAILMETLLPFHWSWLLLIQIMTILSLGVMSLWLPSTSLKKKVFYTFLEFGLIMLPATQGILATRPVFLLCLVLLMRSCLIFKRAGQIVVLVLSLLSYSALLLTKPIELAKPQLAEIVWDSRISNILLFSLTLIFALLLINALLSERQSREKLEKVYQELEMTHQQLHQYALRIEDQATLQERNRIAREIHDGLGHTLTAQTIQINNALIFWHAKSEQSLASLKQAKQLGAEALLEVRKSVSVLRSNPLQGKLLESAIDKLLQDFKQNTGIELSTNIYLQQSLPSDVNTTLYRIIQESLTNIYKHAQAKMVNIELSQQLGSIRLMIEDNGKGFDPTQNTTGFGLQGMKERTSALCGQFMLDSQLEKGCRLVISLPITNFNYAE